MVEPEVTSDRILIVSDQQKWLDFANSVLSGNGYKTKITSSLKTVLDLLDIQEFELILVDLNKIEQDELTSQKIAEIQSKRSQRIVALFPTQLTPEKLSAIFKLGINDCVDKRYNKTGIITLVEAQLTQRPSNILVVEDDFDWRRRLARYLEKDGYQVQGVKSLVEAKIILEHFVFDVIILDLRLIEDSEGFQGIELLNLLKRDGRLSKVIIVSAYGTTEQIRIGFSEYKIFDYIPKQTFDSKKYRETIHRAIEQKHQGD